MERCSSRSSIRKQFGNDYSPPDAAGPAARGHDFVELCDDGFQACVSDLRVSILDGLVANHLRHFHFQEMLVHRLSPLCSWGLPRYVEISFATVGGKIFIRGAP